ncbi:MAG: CZB domain-containing protein [Candidatus Eisenbacteria bacterium]|jgi:methyl-accepting chemotaxis protein|nr:CZB domain-containing protein [Candidatus Eisenbacteria bacterium]
MTHADEIKKAIAAHGLWKSRLRQAIDTGRSQWSVEEIAADGDCDLGRWLQAVEPAADEAERIERIRTLHRKFHREAAQVLQLAHGGQRSVANMAMAAGSPFDRLTSELTRELMLWSRAA